MLNLIKKWQNISITKKLYTVFGIMALLIVTELAALSFVMDTLSSVRAFVGGEGMWSKAQKDAINSLQNYIVSKDPEDYYNFKKYLEVPLGDRQARLELEKPQPNVSNIYAGFLKGKVHYKDINGMVRLLTRFQRASFIQESIAAWRNADRLMDKLILEGNRLHAMQVKGEKLNTIKALRELDVLNLKLTVQEDKFSSILGVGSRWIEWWFWVTLLTLVLTVEATGLIFTLTFSQYLSKGLNKLMMATAKVGEGDFSQQVNIETNDELGKLAGSINKMVISLRDNIVRRKEAEHHNRIKDLFLANMSHEIRTPLSTILGYTQLLENENVSPQDKNKFFKIIQKSGKNLNEIISDILDISKVESGQLSIYKKSFSLHELILDLEKLLRFKCEEKNVLLEVEIDKSLPDHIISDEVRVRQVLLNLLGNAIKFTANGNVYLKALLDKDKIAFDIKDNGMGIKKDDQEKIFELFVQANSEFNRKQGGVGLGLPLSRHLARMLGGDIALVKSDLGEGSYFRFEIQYQPGSVIETAKEENKKVYGLDSIKEKEYKILVVEDSEDIRELIRLILREWKFVVDLAVNGKDGLERALSYNYDLVIMDVQMPVMDGYTAVKELRKNGYEKPIIALTAHAMEQDMQKCIEVGYSDYLSKPLEVDKLIRKIVDLA